MEDYKTKYEIAIKKAKEELKVCGSLDCDAARQIFRFFPELKESEDERIRKALIWYIKYNVSVISGWRKEELITWLEKQDPNRLEKRGKQKFTKWSEKDERMFDRLRKHFDWGSSYYFNRNDCDEADDWLKSLKERYTWKPSNEQMKQLGWVAEQNKDNMIGKELMSLYQDLKILKEE